MVWGNGKLRGHGGNSASKLPSPLDLSCRTLNLTVLEDEFRVAAIGRWPHAHAYAGKSRVAEQPPR
jgi:hypothetical protein